MDFTIRQGSTGSYEPPTIKFTTYQALLEAKQASTECLYIKDVSAEQFALVQRERGEKTPFLVTKIYSFFLQEIIAQGLNQSWVGLNSTTFTNQNNGSAGEGDAAGGPFVAGVGELQDWPTLVIEAGYSQTLNRRLRDQAAWWFRASAHQVKIVLLIKMDPTSPGEILIEKWQEIPPQDRAGATTTRASEALGPNLMQVINIRRVDDAAPTVPQSYAAGGALRLDFAHLFLRQPEQGEGDIIIGIQQLQCVGAALGGIRARRTMQVRHN
ncbi:unnamed protein product [Clonostachys rhizophaga]|uniref:Uncharacterized protein n=1 Tax=Clonostachys rhizophaga TaxID=160324 RepID=A0A9N9V6Z8_9HYPO|nr:unnamed protein product [Clonostachys rhizophaga]